jgi:hypothetical protein
LAGTVHNHRSGSSFSFSGSGHNSYSPAMSAVSRRKTRAWPGRPTGPGSWNRLQPSRPGRNCPRGRAAVRASAGPC